MWVPTLGCGVLDGDKKSKSKKGHKPEEKKKMHFELSPLKVWIALWTVNTYLEFQVNIFSDDCGISECQSFADTDHSDDAKAIATPWISPENRRATKGLDISHTI